MSELLLPRTVTNLPKPIREANEAAHEAGARKREAGERSAVAQKEAKAAPGFDELAARAAVATGEAVPPVTAELKRAEAEEAERTYKAAARNATSALRALQRAIREHYDEYVESRKVATEKVREPIETVIADLLERIVPALVENETYQHALTWPKKGTLAGGYAERLPRLVEKEAASMRRLRRQGVPVEKRQVENTLPALLAALDLQLEHLFATPEDRELHRPKTTLTKAA